MGYIAHDVAVAVISDYDTTTLSNIEAFRARLDAERAASIDPLPDLILGPVVGINGSTTYVFAPDGSKEGWAPSDRAEELRAEFIKIAGAGYGDVVHVRFGGDYGAEVGTTIISTTDQQEATAQP